MNPAVLPVAALGVAMSAFFLPPVLALTGAAPKASVPRAMLLVESQPVAAPVIATGRTPSTPTKVEKVRVRTLVSPVPQFTRLASNMDVVR